MHAGEAGDGEVSEAEQRQDQLTSVPSPDNVILSGILWSFFCCWFRKPKRDHQLFQNQHHWNQQQILRIEPIG
jgi:hypothetical protein